MAKRTGGFIGQDGINAPDPATGVSASGGDAEATVSFTAPTDVGGAAVTGYRVQSDDGIGASGSASPVTVTGLTNGTSYTFNVWAINPFGWSSPSDASGSVSPVAPPRAAVYGGRISDAATTTNSIQYFVITTLGNAADFGDLSSLAYAPTNGSAGSATRSLASAGTTNDIDSGVRNTIEYVDLATTGNTTDFGDLSTARQASQQFSNGTRAVIGYGTTSTGSNTTALEYVTIASTGNATSFGTGVGAGHQNGAGLASSTRGVFNGQGVMDYITIASTGNSTDFGDDLIGGFGRSWFGGASNGTRGLFAGGYAGSDYQNEITYITIASTGNSADFGDLTVGRNSLSGASGNGRAVFMGGFQTGAQSNVIDYVTIATTGNAADFGDMVSSLGHWRSGDMSSGHGGLS
jgi:hypothetical protein